MRNEEVKREWIFGIRPKVQNLVVHLERDKILYPAGRSLVIHSINEPSQTFVPLIGEGDPTALAISHKRFFFKEVNCLKRQSAFPLSGFIKLRQN